MNYGTPYTPNYAAPAAAYAQSPYDAEAYAQAQQHAAALEQLQQMYGAQPSYDPYAQQYPMVYTGQAVPGQMALPGGAVIAATPPNLTPLQGAWWQQSLYGMPYWSIAAGAAALTGIGLAWKAGVFGGKMGGGRSMSRTTVRRSTARDASSPRSGTRSKPSSSASSNGERDMGGRARKRTRAGTRRRRASGGARGRRY